MTESEHYALPPDRTTELAGRKYRAWDGNTYELLSHHRCGFHLRVISATAEGISLSGRKVGDMACISERAIGANYHELREPAEETA